MMDLILGVINILYWKHFCFVKFKCYLIIKLCLVGRVDLKILMYACEYKCVYDDTFTANPCFLFCCFLYETKIRNCPSLH